MHTSLPYRRVDKAILSAFVTLAQRIPFEKLTVQQLLDEALVSRYTFYAHFHDKYEVAERLQAQLYEEFLQFMQQAIPAIDAQALPRPEHHRQMDAAMAAFARSTGVRIQAIKNIHTETIDFFRLVRQYFASNYRAACAAHPQAALEAGIYANMAAAVMDHYASQPVEGCASAVSTESYLNAALYAVGIHDEARLQKARRAVLALL